MILEFESQLGKFVRFPVRNKLFVWDCDKFFGLLLFS
jgi:hypothetical protein